MLDLYVGESESKPEIGETLEIKDAIININEDEDFKYISSTGNEPDEPEIMKFNIYILLLKYSSVTPSCFRKISFHKKPLISPLPLETLVNLKFPFSSIFR